MTRGVSAYLDLLRFLAALQVVLYHLSWTRIEALPRGLLNQWGHEAVVVFFVLSGFVVRHAAETRDHTLADFATSRISRIYSVVFPCLAGTIACDLVGHALAPQLYANLLAPESVSYVFMQALISLTMLNQTIGLIPFLSNEPYWSLCYEFWYYALFAASYYLQGVKRWVALLIVALCAGPKALVLLPIWFVGTLVYTERFSGNWNRPLVWLVFLQPLIVVPLYWYFDLPSQSIQLIGPELAKTLVYSAQVFSDMVLAISLGLHLTAAKRLDDVLWRGLYLVRRLIAAGAARSFTLYLMHQPVMLMLAAVSTVLYGTPGSWFVSLGAICVPLILAPFIENGRHGLRAWLRRLPHDLRSFRRRLNALVTPT
jgi:peptidoglycan/LPS O-acetylase OafA/YrhL